MLKHQLPPRSAAPFGARCRLAVIFLAAALCAGSLAWNARAEGFRVTLSDDVVVLDDKQKWGSIDLVNLGADPMEFTLTVDATASGTARDGTSLIRWAPSKALAPANRSVTMRVSARPPADLPPGEYVFRVGVTAAVQHPPRTLPGEGTDQVQGIAATIPVVPILPVTVYLRHKIEAPMIDAKPLVFTPEDPKYFGYFPVTKRTPGVSFVGQIQLVEQGSGAIISKGRLILSPAQDTSNVRMPRGDTPVKDGARYCLRIWDHFPGKGGPTQEVCGQ
jgi:hypothetical protein